MRWILIWAVVAVLSASADAEEKQRQVISFYKVDDGAMLEMRVAAAGRPVTEFYHLTQLSCAERSNDIRLMLPIDKESSLALADTSLKRAKGRWTMIFKAHGKDYTKKVEFRAINDKRSQIALAAEITINFDDPVWKALVDKSGTKLWVMNGGLGTNVALTDETELSKFLAACQLGN